MLNIIENFVIYLRTLYEQLIFLLGAYLDLFEHKNINLTDL